MDIEEKNEVDKANNLPVLDNTTTATAKLAAEGNDLATKIIETNNINELDDLTKLFEINKKKKSIVRQNRLTNLLTLIDDEIMNRLATTPESIDDKELATYLRTIQATVDKPLEETPAVQINTQHNEININQTTLSRESRAKVLEAVNAIMASANPTIIEAESEEDEEEDD